MLISKTKITNKMTQNITIEIQNVGNRIKKAVIAEVTL